MNPRMPLLIYALAGLLLAPLPTFVHAAPVPAAPSSVSASADTPAVAVVRQYLDARAAGQATRAYVLLSSLSQKGLPLHQEPGMLKEVLNPATQLPAGVLPMVALFVDFHDTLHFEFHVLGASENDPLVVLVRAYQAGMPLSSTKILKIVTVADPIAGGAQRIDGVHTSTIFFPDGPAFAQQAASQLNLEQISAGIILYANAHDEVMPDAEKWVDEIMPYVKNKEIFRDYSAPSGEEWSYAYNRTLSHQPLAALEDPAHTVMLYESTSGTKNASDTGQSVPHPGRHLGGTDYVTADGHAQWFPDNTKLSYRLDGK